MRSRFRQRDFINQHLTFTHGMGLTLGPVNEVTTEGLPVLFIKDLRQSPPFRSRLRDPQIYFGELTNDHVFVNTRQTEFDYPSGDANIYSRVYKGQAAYKWSLSDGGNVAIRFGALNILLSGDISSGRAEFCTIDEISSA